jgi:predicted O-methyltransferase YrrM
MLPAVLREALATGEVRRADGTTTALHSSVTGDEAERLYNVVRARDPRASIEIGLAQGISALAITQALHDNGSGALHYIVDPFQTSHWDGVGLENLGRAGLLDQVRFHESFPEEVVPQLPAAGFAFIDGAHLFDLTMLDFVLVDKRLDVGGVIGFHDLWMASLRDVLRFILTNRGYQVLHDVPRRSVTTRAKLKERISAVARLVPRADRVLNPRVLCPSGELGVPGLNLVFIEKTRVDDRDWNFHTEF